MRDSIFETAHSKVEKFEGDIEWCWDGKLLVPVQGRKVVKPFEVVEKEHNLLVIGGASVLWENLIVAGSSTAGAANGLFNNANAHISVGDSSTAAADTQTELQAATNRVRKPMDATYPQHTDSTGTAGAKSIVFRSTFATTDANFAWNEWGVFNGPGTGGPPTTGARMLQRVAGAALLGTKTSAATWVLTVTLSLA